MPSFDLPANDSPQPVRTGAPGDAGGEEPARIHAAHESNPSVQHDELDDLLLGIQRGDQKLLEQFYDRTSPLVMSLLIRMFRDRQAAEEVCVEVFVHVWRKAVQFDPARGRAAAWLMTITRSRALDELRRRSARSTMTTSMPEESASSDPGLEPLAQLETASVCASLQTALDKLPLAQREPVELSFFSGLSHHRISSLLDQPLGTIKTRIRLGLAALRIHLQPLGFQ